MPLGGIGSFSGDHHDPVRRFITLVDEFYDRHVNLICTAAAAPPLLYTGAKLAGAFERTASRLIEMQSAEYLALAHRGQAAPMRRNRRSGRLLTHCGIDWGLAPCRRRLHRPLP